MASQYHPSRRLVRIEWIDRVCSLAYQAAKVPARAMVKPTAVTISGTPKLSTRLSVTRVPTTEISTTASQ